MQPNDTSFTFSTKSHQISIQKFPIDYYDGDIIILQSRINELYVPEIFTTAENGFASVELNNIKPTEST